MLSGTGINTAQFSTIRQDHAQSAIAGRTTLVHLEGVVSVFDRDGVLLAGLGQQDGVFHAIDGKGNVLTEGPTLEDAMRAFRMI
jgi:hypothetical protein